MKLAPYMNISVNTFNKRMQLFSSLAIQISLVVSINLFAKNKRKPTLTGYFNFSITNNRTWRKSLFQSYIKLSI